MFYGLDRHFPSSADKIRHIRRSYIFRRDLSTIRKSGLFDADYYFALYQDIRNAQADPYIHYLKYGAFEGRNPSALFDTSAYGIDYPDVVFGGWNPLVHYLRIGRKEGRVARPVGQLALQASATIDAVFELLEKSLAKSTATSSATIIVPVFNGYDHLERLLPSLAENTPEKHSILFINDASPDVRIGPMLDKFCAGRLNSRVIHNEVNQGFVVSANRGAANCSGTFVLLNSDTELPSGWVDRLLRPLEEDSSVASATPFSNSATIFSFPVQMKDNELPIGQSVDEVDSAFAAMGAIEAPEAPTGVGFCIAISRDAWEKVGEFDEAEFGKGFGEETDWCRRAASKGFKNVLVPNLFVYHAHGGSFPSAEKAALMAQSERKIIRRHPTYSEVAGLHIARDPWRTLRAAVFWRLLERTTPTLVIDHALGGGANSYRSKFISKLTENGQSVLLATFDLRAQHYVLEARIGQYEFSYRTPSLDSVSKAFASLSFKTCYLNNLVSWPDPLSVLRLVRRVKGNQPVVHLGHDYFAICPSYTLLNNADRFCGVPTDLSVCRACLKSNRNAELFGDIDEWRREWGDFLRACDTIEFYSEASRKLFDRAYVIPPDAARVIPHQPLSDLRPVTISKNGGDCIGVIGSISKPKGAEVVSGLGRYLQVVAPDVKIVVVGEFDGRYGISSNMIVHGRYRHEDLPDLIEKYQISACLLPSIWPETFSYVTQEIMALSLPLVCFDLGAPAERVSSYDHGKVLPLGSTPATIWTALRRKEVSQ